MKFFVQPDGSVVILPKRPGAALRGIVEAQRAVSVAEMNEAVAAGAVGRATSSFGILQRRSDDPIQSRKAAQLFEQGLTESDSGFAGFVTIAETAGVLERTGMLDAVSKIA